MASFVHGGAGGRIAELSDEQASAFAAGLTEAYRSGAAILREGGSAVDAVCAAVRSFEDNPLFNAGRGSRSHCRELSRWTPRS